jgi:hypothetical protein
LSRYRSVRAHDHDLAVITPVESTEAQKPEHEVVLLENFFDYLRRREPVAK